MINSIVLFFCIFMMQITAMMVLLTRDPVHAVFYLISLFLQSSFFLLWIGCEYIAFVFMTVYVGAIAVLFLFVVMMLNTRLMRMKELAQNYVPISIILVITIFIQLLWACNSAFNFMSFSTNSVEFRNVGLNDSFNIVLIAHILYNDFALYFFIAAIILFVGIVGAVTLTFQKKQSDLKFQDPFMQHSRDYMKAVRFKEGSV